MNGSADAGRVAVLSPGTASSGSGWIALAIPALVVAGFAAFTEPRLPAAAIGALALAAWGAFAYARPDVALTLAVPLLIVGGTKFRHRDPDETLGGAIDAQILFELGVFAFIGIAVIAVALRTRFDRGLSGGELLILAYTGIAGVSILWSAEPTLTFVRAGQLAVIAGLAILAHRNLTPAGALWTTLRALIWFVFVATLIATLVPATVLVFPDEGIFRFRWFAVHPLEVAMLTGAATIGVLGIMACRRTPDVPRPGLLMRAIWVAFVVVVVMTSSRGPMVALAAGIGTLFLMKIRLPLRAATILAGTAAVIVTLVYASDVRSWLLSMERRESAATRLVLRTQTVDGVFELNGRMELWTDLLPVVIDHAAMGAGYQASRATVLEIAEWAAYAHNAFIQTVLDLGVVGLLSILGLVALGFKAGSNWRAPIWVRVTVPGLMVFMILNAMANESFSAAPDVELLLLFLCALCGAPQSRAEAGMAA